MPPSGVAALRAFDERDVSMAKACEVTDGFANTEGIVDRYPRAPHGAAVSADRHGWDSRRLARG